MTMRMILVGLLYAVIIASVALLAWQEGHYDGMQEMCDKSLVKYDNGTVGCVELPDREPQYTEQMREITKQNVEGIRDD